jgi:UDP-N-acetylglucosamine 2-epimerase (non-hydrolysing)
VLIGNSYDTILSGAATWLAPAGLSQLRANPAPVRAGAAERAVAAIATLV